ncbi:MAG: hypothetical protein ABIQ70_05175 [Dokdonella sp.]
MQHAANPATAFCFIAFALSLLALVVLLRLASSAQGMAEVGGRALAQTGLAAVLVWFVARRRNPARSCFRFGATWFATVVTFGLIASVALVRAAEPLPFHVRFAPGWSAEILGGLSSAAQDEAAGVRQRAQWKGLDGIAVIELSCAWLTADEHADAGAQLAKISGGLSDGYSKFGLAVQTSASRTLAKGDRTWAAVDVHASDGNGPRLAQTVAVTSSTRCFVTATLSGTPQAFAAQAGEFEAVLDRLRVD